MKFEIRSRWDNSIMFEIEADSFVKAVEQKIANLRDADLRGADLRGADLSHADLRHANLRNADLSFANLSDADLRHANLRNADLRFANLSHADIDYSCWPLWCGSKGVKVDRRIAAQLAAHFCAVDCDDPDYQAAKAAILPFAKTSHRAKELGLSQETN